VNGRVVHVVRKSEGAGSRHKRQVYAASDGGKVQWACAEEQGEEEGWATRARIMKGDANRVVEREGAKEKTADKKRS
jgi:hypothetical protein